MFIAIELPPASGTAMRTTRSWSVSFYAMRGISACQRFPDRRALHLIQTCSARSTGRSNLRSRAPFPRPIPPAQLPENDAGIINAGTAL